MPASLLHALSPMLQRLEHLADFDDGDREAILGLPHRVETLAPHTFIVTEGDPHVSSCVLLSGFAIRHKVAGNGGRQIMALHMVGDLIDLQNSLLDVADHNLQTLSPATVAYIPVEAVAELIATRPAVGRAMWREILIEASIFREWILNIGRRNARARIAHFLCEIAVRMEARELCDRVQFKLPLTQEQLADILGLTNVHVNRTLQSLRTETIIRREIGGDAIADWQALAKIGDFNDAYLYLHGGSPKVMTAAAEYGVA